jgi:hypothetical protein
VVRSEPHDRRAGEVDEQVDQREHRRHQAPRPQAHGGELGVGGAEALGLLGLPDEGPHHADAGDLLPQDPVDAVDALLHQLEGGDHLGHDDPEHDGGERDGHQQHDRQAHVLPQGHDDPDGDGDRGADGHRAHHDDQHLDLLDVVGDPRDQRRCSERRHLSGREVGHLVEEVPPHVPTEAHRHLCPEPHRSGGEHALHDRDAEHDGALPPDEALVVGEDAVVHDAGVDGGQQQRSRGVHGRERDDHTQQPLVGAQGGAEELR